METVTILEAQDGGSETASRLPRKMAVSYPFFFARWLFLQPLQYLGRGQPVVHACVACARLDRGEKRGLARLVILWSLSMLRGNYFNLSDSSSFSAKINEPRRRDSAQILSFAASNDPERYDPQAATSIDSRNTEGRPAPVPPFGAVVSKQHHFFSCRKPVLQAITHGSSCCICVPAWYQQRVHVVIRAAEFESVH